MRWFLGVAIIIVTALVVAHRINDQQVHRARRGAPALAQQTEREAPKPAQAPPHLQRETTSLRLNLLGRPEFTSMVMLFPADSDQRVLPVDVDTDSLRTFDVRTGRYRIALPGGIVLREIDVPCPPVTIDLSDADWTRFSVLLPREFRDDKPIQIAISGKSVIDGASILATRRIVHPRDRNLTFTLDNQHVHAEPAVRATGGHVRLIATAAAEITFGLPQAAAHDVMPTVYRIDPDGPIILNTFRRDELIHAFTVRRTQDVIVHLAGHTPQFFRGVDFTDGTHDCGDLVLDEGATLEITRVDSEHYDFIMLSPHWLDHGLTLDSGWIEESGMTITLRGIPKGKIRIDFETGDKSWSREYESTGKGTRRIKAPSPK